MIKKLRYFMTLLLMMVASVGWAEDVTVSVTLSSGTFTTDHITWSAANGGITIQQLKGTSTNAVNSGYIAAPRLYKGHILSFTAADNYKIKSISITYNGSYCGNSMTAGTEVSENTVTDNTTAVNRTWATANGGTHVVSAVSSDGLSQIYIQNGTTSNTQLRPSSISITYSYSGTAYVDTPTFTPEGEVYSESQNVTISTTTEGATIYYTTDGSDPTTSSTRQTYLSQIKVTANTTIKAYAVKEGYNDSDVAVSTFTIFGGVDPKNINSNYFEKVTDVNKLVNGDAILIVNEEYAKALSTTQSGNYRGEADVTINANTIDAPSAEVQKLVLAGENGAWFLSVGGENSFLYSPKSGNNLETTETVSDAARATITFTEGNAYIRFNGTNTANLISYNYNSGDNSRFSCYVAPQSPVQIYKEVVKPNKEEPGLAYGTTSYEITYGNEFTTPELTNPNELTVAYASSEEGVATVDASTGAVTIKGVGTTTITASFAGDDSFLAGSASYTLTVNADPNASGGVNNPYTVAQARKAISDNEGVNGVYATGKVSAIITALNPTYGNITYDISAEGSPDEDQLRVYRGKSYNGEKFTSEDDIKIGDVVVIYGNLKKYGEIYEFVEGNQLVSLTRPVTPTITVNPTTVEAAATETEGTLTVTYTEIDTQNTPEVLFYAADGTNTATYDWIVTELNSDNNNVDYILSANTGEARTAYLKVHGLDADANDVYSDLITISQAAYVAPGTGYCYKKVTSTEDITDGEYLIVYEDGNVAFDGGHETLDAASNTVDVTILDNMIDATEATNAATFTINTTEGSIKSASGFYIGQTSDANGMAIKKEAIPNTIDIVDGNADIVSGGAYLRYNSTSNQLRFRYFKSATYTGQKAIQLYKKVETEEVPVNEHGKGTYVTKKALDFTGITTVTAYVATSQNGSDVTFDPVTKVPAGTPLLVKGATTDVPVIASATAPAVNLLVAGTGAAVASEAGGKFNFILNYLNGAVGFYRAAENTVAANRAYLSLSENITAAKLNVIFSDETTGINNVNVNDNDNEKIFNLAGQQMKSAVKGVYIKNGRKYVK